MGRHSRSRQVQRNKTTTGPSSAATSHGEEEQASGSLMSMRAGFKSLAGAGDAKQKGKGSLIGWIVVGILALAMVMFLVGR